MSKEPNKTRSNVDDILKSIAEETKHKEAYEGVNVSDGDTDLQKWVKGGLNKVFRSASAAGKAYQTLETIYDKFIEPVANVVSPVLGWYWRGCKNVFNWASHSKDGSFMKSRAAVAGVTLLAATGALAYAIPTTIVPNAVHFTYDAVAINAFDKHDTLVFSQPSPVEGEPGILSVYACRQYPCEGQTDSVEFRMRDSVYLDFVRFATRGEFHDPGELAGAFVSEENACNVTYYGTRNKTLGWYPYIFEATCRPINGNDADTVLDQMRSLRDDIPEVQAQIKHEAPADIMAASNVAYATPQVPTIAVRALRM